MRPKISFLVHDLADNPVGRTIALAKALSPLYEIEIAGFLISGTEVCVQYRSLYPYKAIPCGYGLKNIYRNFHKLCAAATGDIIYACKPLITSFLPAVTKAVGGRTVFLDMDDDNFASPDWKVLLKDPLIGFRNADGWGYAHCLRPMMWMAQDISVVSRTLQKRFGGVLIRHGPDETEFDPGRVEFADPMRCRRTFGLPDDRKLVLFSGTPRAHKGVPILVEALLRSEARNWDFVLVAPPQHPDVRYTEELLGTRCHLIGNLPYQQIPEILAAIDAVVIPQLRTPFAEGQVPAKLLDALAMAKPIIATDVGDNGEILGYGERGIVIPPASSQQIATALATIEENPDLAVNLGLRGREWYLREASAAVNRSRLDEMIHKGASRVFRAPARAPIVQRRS